MDTTSCGGGGRSGAARAREARQQELFADYERMQQQQRLQQDGGFLEDEESGPCGSSSTCWGPDNLPPPGVIPPGGVEKVLEYRAVPNGKGAVEVRRRVATSAEGPIDHIQVVNPGDQRQEGMQHLQQQQEQQQQQQQHHQQEQQQQQQHQQQQQQQRERVREKKKKKKAKAAASAAASAASAHPTPPCHPWPPPAADAAVDFQSAAPHQADGSAWPMTTASDLAREAAAVIAQKKSKRRQQQEAAMQAEQQPTASATSRTKVRRSSKAKSASDAEGERRKRSHHRRQSQQVQQQQEQGFGFGGIGGFSATNPAFDLPADEDDFLMVHNCGGSQPCLAYADDTAAADPPQLTRRDARERRSSSTRKSRQLGKARLASPPPHLQPLLPHVQMIDDVEVDLGPNGYYDEVSHDGDDGGGLGGDFPSFDEQHIHQPFFPFTSSAVSSGYDPRLRRYFNDDISLLAANLPPPAFQSGPPQVGSQPKSGKRRSRVKKQNGDGEERQRRFRRSESFTSSTRSATAAALGGEEVQGYQAQQPQQPPRSHTPDSRSQSPLLSAVRAKRAAQAHWEATQKQEIFTQPSQVASGITFGAELISAPLHHTGTSERPQTSMSMDRFVEPAGTSGGGGFNGGDDDDLGEPIYDVSTDDAVGGEGLMRGGVVNGESDEIPPPPSPPCTCGKNLELPPPGGFAPDDQEPIQQTTQWDSQSLDLHREGAPRELAYPPPRSLQRNGGHVRRVSVLDCRSERSGYPSGQQPLSMNEAGGMERGPPGRLLSGSQSRGIGVPDAMTAESVAAAAGDVASSLIVSPPPAIQPRFHSLSRYQQHQRHIPSYHRYRDGDDAEIPNGILPHALPAPPHQFGGGHVLRRAASDFCNLEGPDCDAVDHVQLAVQQRRSGSGGGRPDSVIDFDAHAGAQTSSTLFRDQQRLPSLSNGHAAAAPSQLRPRSADIVFSNGFVNDAAGSTSRLRGGGVDVDLDGAEDLDRLLEKKPSRHHRQQRGSGHGRGGGRGGGGSGGGKRPLRATLLRGERGISIEFGKFVALISISGVRRQHCLLIAIASLLLLLLCLVIGLSLSGGSNGDSSVVGVGGEGKNLDFFEAATTSSSTTSTSSSTTSTTSMTTTPVTTTTTRSTSTASTIATTVEPPILPWPKTSEERRVFVRNLLTQVPLVDGHNDLPWNIRKFIHNKLNTVNFTHDLRSVSPWSESPWSHTDLKRLKEGMVGAQLWVAYAPCGSQHKDAVQVTLEQIDLIKRFVAQYPDHVRFANDSAALLEAHAEGRVASLISVESGHSIGTSLAVLRMFHRLGAVSLTLTHTCNTPWADCSHVDKPGVTPEHGGLTEFGKTVIREMNRLGMIVDLSHSSHQTSLDAIHTSEAPVIFSHSSAHAVCNSTRNVHDDVLRILGQRGGLVMVNFFSHFLTCSNSSSIYDVVEHLNHIRAIAGVECVGIGASYDGINSAPRELGDVSKYPELFATLLASGMWTLEDLKKLAGLNFVRVFQEVEKVSARLRAALPIAEEFIPGEAVREHYDCRSMAKRDNANNTAC